MFVETPTIVNNNTGYNNWQNPRNMPVNPNQNPYMMQGGGMYNPVNDFNSHLPPNPNMGPNAGLINFNMGMNGMNMNAGGTGMNMNFPNSNKIFIF